MEFSIIIFYFFFEPFPYIYLKNKTPSLIVFTFNVLKNLGVALFTDERNKATSRTHKFNRLTYSGPTITIGIDGKWIFCISAEHATIWTQNLARLRPNYLFNPFPIFF